MQHIPQLPFFVIERKYRYTHLHREKENRRKKKTQKKKKKKTQKKKMAMVSTILCLIFFTSLSVSSSSTLVSAASVEKPSAYEILETYNFPIGILPKGVVDYTLETDTGKFSASFNGSCSFSLEGSYQLRYKSTIKGFLSNGRLSNLEGVSVKLFFFWADIVDVRRSGDNLEFSVGIAAAGFSIDNFEECPQCGCGLNCNNNGEVKKIRRNPFVSSS